jgi:UDP-glucuronate decarboxylase
MFWVWLNGLKQSLPVPLSHGDPQVHPQPESYWGACQSYWDPFSATMQACAETLFMDYHNQNQVAIKIIRIFNTYGPI